MAIRDFVLPLAKPSAAAVAAMRGGSWLSRSSRGEKRRFRSVPKVVTSSDVENELLVMGRVGISRLNKVVRGGATKTVIGLQPYRIRMSH